MFTKAFTVQHEFFRSEKIDETLPDGTHVGGHRSILDHVGHEQVVVCIDLEKLALQLGHKAINSKRGVAVEIGGIVTVRHVRTAKQAQAAS